MADMDFRLKLLLEGRFAINADGAEWCFCGDGNTCLRVVSDHGVSATLNLTTKKSLCKYRSHAFIVEHGDVSTPEAIVSQVTLSIKTQLQALLDNLNPL